MTLESGPVLVQVTRGGAVESVHRGHAIVTSEDAEIHVAFGDPDLVTYPRSSLKPFQALASLDLLGTLPERAVAIACASHEGTADHQIEAAHVLALAGLDERALRCPPALPTDPRSLLDQGEAQPLAHNCSGKHAAFLAASVAAGADPARYLEPDSPVQERVRLRIQEWCGGPLDGRGVDGCGAPAWRLPLRGLATGFARLVGATDGTAALVYRAMTANPLLIGGRQAVDSALMRADERVLAKRGAEAVFAAGFAGPDGPLGIAVKVADGGNRAAGVVAAALLTRLGARVPEAVPDQLVLAGGVPHGRLEPCLPA